MLNLERDILPFLTIGPHDAGSVPTPPKAHAFYARSIAHVLTMQEVFADDYPKYLDINRPNESAKNKAYRKRVYRNPYRSYPNRVKGALDYIRQADDFEVKFPTIEDSVRDRLESYTGTDFSASGDVVSWFFEYAVRDYLRDPNSVLLTLPEAGTVSDTDYPEPRLQLFPSAYVWTHQVGKSAVLCSPKRGPFQQRDGSTKEQGLVLYFCDHESFTIARQVGFATTNSHRLQCEWQIMGLRQMAYDPDKPELGAFEVYPDLVEALGGLPDRVEVWDEFTPSLHYCKTLPAMKLGRVLVDSNASGEEFYESLLADAVPHLKDGQQAKSDHQVELNFHVSSKEWQRAQRKCGNPACQGGQVIQEKKKPQRPPGQKGLSYL